MVVLAGPTVVPEQKGGLAVAFWARATAPPNLVLIHLSAQLLCMVNLVVGPVLLAQVELILAPQADLVAAVAALLFLQLHMMVAVLTKVVPAVGLAETLTLATIKSTAALVGALRVLPAAVALVALLVLAVAQVPLAPDAKAAAVVVVAEQATVFRGEMAVSPAAVAEAAAGLETAATVPAQAVPAALVCAACTLGEDDSHAIRNYRKRHRHQRRAC